ncbi:MAG: choline kinase [Myxococcota bacterium]|jgi:choline kinase
MPLSDVNPKHKTIGVILAAGIGSRLRPYTIDCPKALVALDNGETILSRLTDQCKAVGVDEMLLVTGHCADAVDTFLASNTLSLPTRTVFNPRFDTMNNGESLNVVREAVQGATIIKFDGDLVLHPDMLGRLAHAKRRSTILLDATKVLVDEDYKAQVNPETGLVTGLGKWLPNTASGVSIGIERIDVADQAIVFDALHRMIHIDGHSDRYYEDAYYTVLDQGFALGFVSTDGLPWIECDTESELMEGRALAAKFPAVRPNRNS